MKFDDLEAILPEQVKTAVGNRRVGFLLLLGVLLLGCAFIVTVSLTAHYAARVNSLTSTSTQAGHAMQGGKCVSPHCLMVAANLLANSAETGTPAGFSGDRCSNFYEYACGGWSAANSIPADVGFTSALFELWHKNEERLRDAVEQPIRRPGEHSAERKLKEFFRMCLHDYGRAKEAGMELVRILRTDLRGAYLLDPDWQNTWTMGGALTTLQRDYLVNALFELRVELSPLQREKNIIAIYPSGLGLREREYLVNSNYTREVVKAYKTYMRDVAALLMRDAGVTFNDDEKKTRIDQFVEDAYNQERSLANDTVSAKRISLINLVKSLFGSRSAMPTISQLERNFTQIPWKTVIQGVYTDQSTVNENTIVRLDTPLYFRGLDQILQEESQANTRDRMLNNYFVWRLVDTYANHLSWEYRQARFRFLEMRQGSQEFPPVWDECLGVVGTRMGVALAAEFLNAHIGSAKKENVRALYEAIRESFVDSIDNIPWLTDETKPIAKEKVKAIDVFVGFPEDYFDVNYVDNLLSAVTINSDDGYFRSLLNTNHHLRQLYTARLKAGYQFFMWQRVFNRGGFGVYPSYFRQFNDVIVPAGSFQLPLFTDLGPQYLNYGAMGAAMAETMMYAINEVGRMYTNNGSTSGWWSDETLTRYNGAINCTADYLSTLSAGPYFVDGEQRMAQIDGRSNARDTMVIVAGLRVALKAYRKWVSQNEELPLPGLPLTNEQAFFLAATQSYCFLERDKDAFEFASSGGIPDDLRLNAIFRRMPEFVNAFQCPRDQTTTQCSTM